MGRLRFRHRHSLTEAQAEATRRAEAFMAGRLDRDKFQLRGARPDSELLLDRASKCPDAWVVVFAPVPPEGGVIDGGELFVFVDLKLETVGIRHL